ncbi:carboxylesterase/lipase family protein [Kutzneria sp. NPDC052558]|uniref:carboxylesterase/lipase family protein n=1 Tax=Kutzneria sp. NPDC052558 TaxID=3364121 RepID=UPI0037CA795E
MQVNRRRALRLGSVAMAGGVLVKPSGGSTTVVCTRQGRLRGVRDGDIDIFKGVRFAEAPTGPHRFAPPRPVRPWTGIRDATAFADEPLQVGFSGQSATGVQDEDCLFLNIWSPSAAGRRPVIVWITGGGFIAGAGSQYDGSVYARREDIVFVTINYRLNAFGYLHQAARPGSGNAGLLDQIEALRWVRDNITAFGGDPGNVTVMGESAGGMSIGILLGTPAARGLFRRAIVQSGGARPTASPQGIGFTTTTVMKALGIDDSAQLTDVPAKDLLAVAAAIGNAPSDVKSEPFHPVIDGVVLDRHPLDRLNHGVDVLIGTCDRDYLRVGQWPSQLEYDIRQVADWDRLLSIYTNTSSAGRDPKYDLLGGGFVQLPSIWLAEALLRVGSRVWQYTFDYAGAGPNGALHSTDVAFTFGSPRSDSVAQAISDQMVGAFGAFARSGDPSTSALPHWPAVTRENRATLSFDVTPAIKADRIPAVRRAAWDGVDPRALC